MRPTTRFRQLLARQDVAYMPGVGDPFTARIVAREGYEVLCSSGNATSAMRLGMPDVGLLTLMENVENAGRIAEASGLPVMADADTGYGNPLTVRRTIREFENAGVAAVMIEDQVAPKRCGMLAGKQVIPAADMAAKIRAAADARRDPDLVIVGRTDSRAVEGIERAIERAVLYAESGADLLFVEGPQSMAEIEAISKAARSAGKPLLYNLTPTGPTPKLPAPELAGLGFRLVGFSVYALLAAIPAMQGFLRQFKATGDLTRVTQPTASLAEYNEILGLPEWQAQGDRYAT